MKFSMFRHWVRNLWNENCEERLTFKERPATLDEYIKQHKWFLKQKYKETKE